MLHAETLVANLIQDVHRDRLSIEQQEMDQLFEMIRKEWSAVVIVMKGTSENVFFCDGTKGQAGPAR